jgi:nitrous oxidase accessory protein
VSDRLSPGRVSGVRVVVLAAAVMVAACSSGEPRPIRIGHDRCANCLMGIAEERFAAELITRTGKMHMFDSIECLAGFVEYESEAAGAKSVWVTDHEGPPRLLEADRAFYIRSDSIRSPMGLGIAAYANRATRDAALELLGEGEPLDWDGVRATVRAAWPGGSPHGGSASSSEMAGALASHNHGSGDTAIGRLALAPAAAVYSIRDAIAAAPAGARVVVPPGWYSEPTLELSRPIELVAGGEVVLDGGGERGLIVVRSDDVTIRGFTLRNTGRSFVEDRAAIRIEKARRCAIEDNTIEDAFFAIYLASAADCLIRGNRLTATEGRETFSGNGIHVWYSRDITIADNAITGYRDGIYFEFVMASRVTGNTSGDNLRYGLHFMFSDSCTYERNVFRANGAGVAVMYARFVEMTGNAFVENWGTAAFGLLLKDIRDSRIADNTFDTNSIGLYAEASSRVEVTGNDFTRNGWAVKLLANSENSRFTANNFEGNTFDVATNSRRTYSEFEGNWWAAYRGYDLDRDGIGDVPHRPVRLFSLLVERNEPSLILLHSFLVGLLDAAEAVIPALTPETLQDVRPLMDPAPRHPRVTARARAAVSAGNDEGAVQ